MLLFERTPKEAFKQPLYTEAGNMGARADSWQLDAAPCKWNTAQPSGLRQHGCCNKCLQTKGTLQLHVAKPCWRSAGDTF